MHSPSVHQLIVTWQRPQLDPDEEIDLGEDIAREGKRAYYNRFWRSLLDPRVGRSPRAVELPLWRRVALLLMLMLPFIALSTWLYAKHPRALLQVAAILIASLLTAALSALWAFYRYKRWLAHLVRCYQSNSPENTRIARAERRAMCARARAVEMKEVNELLQRIIDAQRSPQDK